MRPSASLLSPHARRTGNTGKVDAAYDQRLSDASPLNVHRWRAEWTIALGRLAGSSRPYE